MTFKGTYDVRPRFYDGESRVFGRLQGFKELGEAGEIDGRSGEMV